MKEASSVYVALSHNYRVSRNARAAWYLDHLYKSLTPLLYSYNDGTNIVQTNKDEFQLLGITDQDSSSQQTQKFCNEVSPEEPIIIENGILPCRCEFEITETTQVHFLSWQYRLAIVIDASDSVFRVGTECVRIDAMIASLEIVLRGLASPLSLPLGCRSNAALFRPTIYI